MYERRFIELIEKLNDEQKKKALLDIFKNAKFTDKLVLIATVEDYINR